jgi:hypothetical protein
MVSPTASERYAASWRRGRGSEPVPCSGGWRRLAHPPEQAPLTAGTAGAQIDAYRSQKTVKVVVIWEISGGV